MNPRQTTPPLRVETGDPLQPYRSLGCTRAEFQDGVTCRAGWPEGNWCSGCRAEALEEADAAWMGASR